MAHFLLLGACAADPTYPYTTHRVDVEATQIGDVIKRECRTWFKPICEFRPLTAEPHLTNANRIGVGVLEPSALRGAAVQHHPSRCLSWRCPIKTSGREREKPHKKERKHSSHGFPPFKVQFVFAQIQYLEVSFRSSIIHLLHQEAAFNCIEKGEAGSRIYIRLERVWKPALVRA